MKLNFQKTEIIASGTIISWQIVGGKVEIVTYFIFLGSKITADGDCSHEIKTAAPWKKSYDKQCCDEHWGARVSFRSGFLSVYAQKWDCWVIWMDETGAHYTE